MGKLNSKFIELEPAKWIFNESYWKLPMGNPLLTKKDAFMLGGNGRISARMGMQERHSTIDRIMGPEYDSFSYRQNNYFRKAKVGISGSNLSACITEWQKLWRVPGTAIVCTHESVSLDNRKYKYIEIVTVNYVLPTQPVLMRLIVVKNCSLHTIGGIQLVVSAEPDIIWPKIGHCSEIKPNKKGCLIETVTEYIDERTLEPEKKTTDKVQRYRYCLRGLIGGKSRGWDQLASDDLKLAPGEEKVFIAYAVTGANDYSEQVDDVEADILEETNHKGIFASLERTRRFWSEWKEGNLSLICNDQSVSDFFDATTVHAKQAEHHTGGFMVGDDYTQVFGRDSNGPHKWLLCTGHINEVQRSMNLFFQADVWQGRFCNDYHLDNKDILQESDKPYWFEQDDPSDKSYVEKYLIERIQQSKNDINEFLRARHMTPGDVPNIRILWYWWYHLQTGDLGLVEERWDYLKALIRLQHFELYNYLAGFARDETYGIEPGVIRQGNSTDNSFYALAAVRALSVMAARLGKREEAIELDHLAANIDNSINSLLWIENRGFYAMRITPEGILDDRPCSPALLRPLWLGIMAPSNERVIRSVDYVLEKMMIAPGYIRTIETEYYPIPGHYPAYLLVNLCKLDHPYVEQAFSDLMLFICPSGLCGEYYSFENLRPNVSVHRARPWETGLNAEAIFYYLTGLEMDVYIKEISLKPHIPSQWNEFCISNISIGASRLHLSVLKKDEEVKYELEYSGLDRYKIRFKLLIPDHWECSKVTVNDQVINGKYDVGYYRKKTCQIEFEIQNNEKKIILLKSED